MKLNFFPAASVRAIAFMLLVFGLALPARAQFGPDTALRVGVFSRALVVQAFYRSSIWNAKLQTMLAERNKAVTGGDATKLDAIDRELNELQSLAQRQVDGDAPLTNILGPLAAEWPAIAKEAGVDIIVERPIVVSGGKAALGRPPETVLKVL